MALQGTTILQCLGEASGWRPQALSILLHPVPPPTSPLTLHCARTRPESYATKKITSAKCPAEHVWCRTACIRHCRAAAQQVQPPGCQPAPDPWVTPSPLPRMFPTPTAASKKARHLLPLGTFAWSPTLGSPRIPDANCRQQQGQAAWLKAYRASPIRGSYTSRIHASYTGTCSPRIISSPPGLRDKA